MDKENYARQYQAFTELLIAARKQAGLTQQQLATQLGKPQSFVSKYEKGDRRLDVIEFVEIAGLLDADMTELLSKLG